MSGLGANILDVLISWSDRGIFLLLGGIVTYYFTGRPAVIKKKTMLQEKEKKKIENFTEANEILKKFYQQADDTRAMIGFFATAIFENYNGNPTTAHESLGDFQQKAISEINSTRDLRGMLSIAHNYLKDYSENLRLSRDDLLSILEGDEALLYKNLGLEETKDKMINMVKKLRTIFWFDKKLSDAEVINELKIIVTEYGSIEVRMNLAIEVEMRDIMNSVREAYSKKLN